MSEMVNKLIEIPHGFERPGYLIGAVAITGVGIIADRLMHRSDRADLNRAVPLADPDIAEMAHQGIKKHRSTKRLGYAAGIATASLVLAQQADSYDTHTEIVGSPIVVIDAGYGADARDVTSGGEATSRLSAAVNSVLRASSGVDAEISFLAIGNNAEVVDQVPKSGKRLDETAQHFEDTLSPSFRNGRNIADGLKLAASLNTDKAPKVIFVSTGDIPETEQVQIGAIRETIESKGGVLAAVVIGTKTGAYTIGGQEYEAGISTSELQASLQADKVTEVTTQEDSEKTIRAFMHDAIETHQRTKNDFFKSWALVSVGALATVSIVNRFRGFGQRLRSNRKKL